MHVHEIHAHNGNPLAHLFAEWQCTCNDKMAIRLLATLEEVPSMAGEIKERWVELCEAASVEMNPDRLMRLTAEIVRLLDKKNEALRSASFRTDGRIQLSN